MIPRLLNKIISSHNTIELQASRIANREVKRKDIPGILTNICNNTCEADYLDCVIGKIPNIDPGGHPSRANRDLMLKFHPAMNPIAMIKKMSLVTIYNLAKIQEILALSDVRVCR